jgi:hypothetical protein
MEVNKLIYRTDLNKILLYDYVHKNYTNYNDGFYSMKCGQNTPIIGCWGISRYRA